MAVRAAMWEVYAINRAVRQRYGSNARLANIVRGERNGDTVTFRGHGRCPKVVTVKLDSKAKTAVVVDGAKPPKSVAGPTRAELLEMIAKTHNLDFLERMLKHEMKTVQAAAKKRLKLVGDDDV